MITSRLRFVEDVEKSLAERKKELRSYMRSRRSETTNRDVKEELLTERFFEVCRDERMGAGTRLTAFVYLSYSSEAPTDKLIRRLQEEGWKVFCPRVEGAEMVAVAYGEDFTLSERGIIEPCGEAHEGDIAIAIVPLLAVDKQGNRLGYGGGYYDRYLKKHPNTKRIGYCFDFQVLPSVPAESCDEKLDCIVTEKQTVWITE